MPPPDLAQLIAFAQYPGLARPEALLAQKWLYDHGSEYDRIEFNVRLGAGAELPAGLDAAIIRQATLSSQKRADIVAIAGNAADIVEVKQRATLGALGQLLGYKHHHGHDFPDLTVRRLIVVAGQADPDARGPYQANGIDLVLYPGI